MVLLALFAFDRWLDQHQKLSEADWNAAGDLSWGHANMDYKRTFILPDWALNRLKTEHRERFERVTIVDLRLDNINRHRLNTCPSIEFLRT